MTITSQSSPRADRLLIRNPELAAKNPGGRDRIEIYIDRTLYRSQSEWIVIRDAAKLFTPRYR